MPSLRRISLLSPKEISVANLQGFSRSPRCTCNAGPSSGRPSKMRLGRVPTESLKHPLSFVNMSLKVTRTIR